MNMKQHILSSVKKPWSNIRYGKPGDNSDEQEEAFYAFYHAEPEEMSVATFSTGRIFGKGGINALFARLIFLFTGEVSVFQKGKITPMAAVIGKIVTED